MKFYFNIGKRMKNLTFIVLETGKFKNNHIYTVFLLVFMFYSILFSQISFTEVVVKKYESTGFSNKITAITVADMDGDSDNDIVCIKNSNGDLTRKGLRCHWLQARKLS